MKGLQLGLGVFLFLAELMLWFGVGKLAYLLVGDKSRLVAWLVAIFSVGLVLLFWSFFMSPKADHRLDLLPRILVIVALTILTGLGLLKLGDTVLGWIMLVPVLLVLIVGQYYVNLDV